VKVYRNTKVNNTKKHHESSRATYRAVKSDEKVDEDGDGGDGDDDDENVTKCGITAAVVVVVVVRLRTSISLVKGAIVRAGAVDRCNAHTATTAAAAATAATAVVVVAL
jgi:hypothetical protein